MAAAVVPGGPSTTSAGSIATARPAAAIRLTIALAVAISSVDLIAVVPFRSILLVLIGSGFAAVRIRGAR
ncbi:MAG: hypothetical protein ABSB96_03755 [Gaiellaceae bacterium]